MLTSYFLLIMNYRYMRLVLFFDLPVETSVQRRSYRQFVKGIKKAGFYMLQESVYIKLGIDIQSANSSIDKIKKFIPKEGKISVLTITEKQFAQIQMLLGDSITNVIDTDERIVEL